MFDWRGEGGNKVKLESRSATRAITYADLMKNTKAGAVDRVKYTRA